MKKQTFLPVPAALFLSLSLSACASGGAEYTEPTTLTAPEASETVEASETAETAEASETTKPAETSQSETAEQAREGAVSPALALLPYRVGTVEFNARQWEGVYLGSTEWTESEDYALFREVFFGTWESDDPIQPQLNPLVLDDSEQSFPTRSPSWRLSGFYEVGSDVLALRFNDNAEAVLFWLDRNDPDVLYSYFCSWGNNDELYFPEESAEEVKPAVFRKTDVPPGEPAEDFLSLFKLHELSQRYGVGFELLTEMGYMTKTAYQGQEIYIHFLHDDWYQFYPTYLVSESPDRLELKTRIGNRMYEDSPEELPKVEVDIRYTLERINGEWTRTVEFLDSPYEFVELKKDDTGLWKPPADFIG